LLRIDPNQNVNSVFRWRSNQAADEGTLPGLSARWETEVRLGNGVDSTAHVKLQIGGKDPGIERAEAFLPAATVGVDHHGTTIRGDGSVCLPLSAPRPSDEPDSVSVLSDLLNVI
ncbi:MAG: hypothetical protein AAFX06_29030, partial [Planctomycetota bacterium]